VRSAIRTTVAGLALAGAVLSGCAQGAAPPSGPPTTPPPTAAPVVSGPPGTNPDGPPTGFTDLNKREGWIVGVVTRGGTGPCYGFQAEDGETLALHSTEGIELEQGATVWIKAVPAQHRISCGEGRQMSLRAVESLG